MKTKYNKYSRFFICTFAYCLISIFSPAQNTKIDSLKKVLFSAKADTNKVNTLDELAWQLLSIGDYVSGLTYSNNAFELAAKIKFKKGMVTVKNTIGVIYAQQGNYPEALKEYFFALKTAEAMLNETKIPAEKKSLQKRMATFYNNIGNIYYEQDNYPEALKEYFACLKIKEKIGEKKGIAYSHNNIGVIYKEQGKYPEALKELFFALKTFEEEGDQYGVASSLGNLGSIYYRQGIASMNNTHRQRLFDEALKAHFLSLKIREEIGDKFGMSNTLNCIGAVYIAQNKPGEAKKRYETALKISKEIGSKLDLKYSYIGLSEADSALGNYKAALENYKLNIVYSDSLTNEENTKKIVQQQMQFQFDKSQTADSIKNAEHQKQEELKHNQEIKQQKIYTYGGVIGFLLMIIVAGVSFRAFRNKQKANEIIAEQKKLVEEKQKDILDSIHYAKRIQIALLPSEKYISANLIKLQYKK